MELNNMNNVQNNFMIKGSKGIGMRNSFNCS